MFQELDQLEYEEAEITAGAFACSDRYLAVGTYSGWALFDTRTLEHLRSDPSMLQAHGHVQGVQLSGDRLILLGFGRYQALETPRDWAARLYEMALPDGAPEAVFELPPGNWRMVHHVAEV